MTKPPPTPLSSYLDKEEISDADFAQKIGRDRTMVNKIKLGRVRPTLDLAAVIERETGGAIPMQEWTDLSGQQAAA